MTNSWLSLKKKLGFFFISLLITSVSWAQQGDPISGAKLFKQNCSACHKMGKVLIGPDLEGVTKRYEKEWLHKWIKDNQALIASGDKQAVEASKFSPTDMLPFPNLSDKDIDDILAYTDDPKASEEKKEEPVAVSNSGTSSEPNSTNIPTKVIWISFIALAALLVWLITRINKLISLLNQKLLDGVQIEKPKREPIDWAALAGKYSFVLYGFAGLLALGALNGVWNFAMGIGVYKDYQPVQPIAFSHKIHAGDNGIDCQYCHSSAKEGKVSGIPSANVCMNCHRMISEYNGEEEKDKKDFYDKEIKKIYAAVGWDAEKQTYTGEEKPIEWVRIHNMQDFVYFNHSQHVIAGEEKIKAAKNVDVVCKACHGDVDKMEEVRMANDFTMSWCIECHRQTEVDMNNEYYKDYYKELHAKLAKFHGKDQTITVDAIGGMECGKCHY